MQCKVHSGCAACRVHWARLADFRSLSGSFNFRAVLFINDGCFRNLFQARRNTASSIRSEGSGDGDGLSAEKFMLNTANEQLLKALRGEIGT